MNPWGVQGQESQAIIENIAPTISLIGIIVKSARTVQSSKVVLTIYYVTISDEQHAELLPRFKLLHFRRYLAERIGLPPTIQRSVCRIA